VIRERDALAAVRDRRYTESLETEASTMILTVLEARVPAGGDLALQEAYRSAGQRALPAGLVQSQLLRDARDATRWRIQSWWSSREALEAMRSQGTPGGVLMFRAAGAEPELSIFEVMAGLPAP
jgi:heme-degrading monooxygenase HmoA